MLLRLHTQEAVGPLQAVDLPLGRQLTLLTGDNGLGKSLLLDLAFAAAGGFAASPRFAALPFSNGNGWSFLRDRSFNLVHPESYPAPWEFTLTLYAHVSGNFYVLDPALVHDSQRPQAGCLVLNQSELMDGRSAKEDPQATPFEGMVRDLVHWQAADPKRWAAFEAVLAVLNGRLTIGEAPAFCFGEPKRVHERDARKFPMLKLPHGLVSLDLASAGMRRILSLAYVLVWAWHNHLEVAALRQKPSVWNLLLLVDEMDIHLHPKWQRGILPALLAVGQALEPEVQVQVVAATHSPLVLASLEPHLDPSRQKLFHLEDGPTHTVIQELPLEANGDVDAWLRSEAFGLRESRSSEAEALMLEASRLSPQASAESKQKVEAELARLLGPTDPFWLRWRLVHPESDKAS